MKKRFDFYFFKSSLISNIIDKKYLNRLPNLSHKFDDIEINFTDLLNFFLYFLEIVIKETFLNILTK